MTKLSSFLLAIALGAAATTATAQTTALDWTKTDCNGGPSHHLFSELDSGYVVIQEYVMLGGCQPCITAGNVLKSIYNDYQISNPGKVRIYQTAFENTSSCSAMSAWGSTNGFGHARQFTTGGAEVSYYGGMGMPTIVVMGGGSMHKVYYNEQGSVSGQASQDLVRDAIDMAMADALGVEFIAPGSFKVYPSPAVAGSALRVSIAKGSIAQIQVLSLTGQVIASTAMQGAATEASVQLPQVATGMYLLRITDAQGNSGTQKLFIENN